MKPEEEKQAEGRTMSLVILDEDGAVQDIALMNEKGWKKSTEDGFLWTVNQETGRLLPYRGKLRFRSLEQAFDWYTAVLPVGGKRTGGEGADSAGSGEDNRAADRPAVTAAPDGEGETAARILSLLRSTIEERKRTLPEGSYTTYLFREGADRIRQKTGEEAIELILARERSEVISEAADLLYHLLVLLCALGVEFDEVLAELGRRHR